VIEVRGLSKSFGGNRVVDDLSFVVRDGSVTGFLGPNGAGKSTTMRCMLGLDRPASGEVLFDGVPFASLKDPLRHVGSLLDAKYMNPSRSARNHLRYLAASNGLAGNRADEILEQVGLTTVANKRVGTFSLGMQQRLGIGAALLGDPKTFLFDEPVNGLDPEGILWVRNFMRYLASQGRAVLVSSHLLSEMANTADNLVVIGQGRLISQGTVSDFVAANVDEWVSVRSPQASALAAAVQSAGGQVRYDGPTALGITHLDTATVGEIAARNNIVLHELMTKQASLEEAYLQATAGSAEYRSKPIAPSGPPPGVAPPPIGSPLPPPGMPS
jgi:ABC-2 type transport system ATP-binding protein